MKTQCSTTGWTYFPYPIETNAMKIRKREVTPRFKIGDVIKYYGNIYKIQDVVWTAGLKPGNEFYYEVKVVGMPQKNFNPITINIYRGGENGMSIYVEPELTEFEKAVKATVEQLQPFALTNEDVKLYAHELMKKARSEMFDEIFNKGYSKGYENGYDRGYVDGHSKQS